MLVHGDVQGDYKRRSLGSHIQVIQAVGRGDARAVWNHLQSRGKQALSVTIKERALNFGRFPYDFSHDAPAPHYALALQANENH